MLPTQTAEYDRLGELSPDAFHGEIADLPRRSELTAESDLPNNERRGSEFLWATPSLSESVTPHWN